jgi:hypothetical protein
MSKVPSTHRSKMYASNSIPRDLCPQNTLAFWMKLELSRDSSIEYASEKLYMLHFIWNCTQSCSPFWGIPQSQVPHLEHLCRSPCAHWHCHCIIHCCPLTSLHHSQVLLSTLNHRLHCLYTAFEDGSIFLFNCPKKKKKNKAVRSRHQWLTPRILATWEAAIRRIAVQSQSQANSSWDPIFWK